MSERMTDEEFEQLVKRALGGGVERGLEGRVCAEARRARASEAAEKARAELAEAALEELRAEGSTVTANLQSMQLAKALDSVKADRDQLRAKVERLEKALKPIKTIPLQMMHNEHLDQITVRVRAALAEEGK